MHYALCTRKTMHSFSVASRKRKHEGKHRSLHVRESGFRNLANFCLWNPESHYRLDSRDQKSTDKGWKPVLGIRDPESKTVLDSLTWGETQMPFNVKTA